MKILPALFGFGLVFALVFCVPKTVFASYYFSDEFDQTRAANTLDTNKWTLYPNQLCSWYPTIQEGNGYIKLTQCTYTNKFPYIVSKINPFPSGNWSTEIAFTYTTVTNWGTGIALAEQAPANGGSFSSLLTVEVWQDKSLVNMRVAFGSVEAYTTSINTTPHVFKVERKGQKYYLYLDNKLIYTSPDTTSEVKSIWMGNPTIPPLNVPQWTDFKVDYIRVSQIAPSTPVVFIPGMGGSELKANADTFWSKDNGHGGTFSHAYQKDEKIWVNQNEAVKPGDDDYFDVLKLKPDGITPEADVTLTGNLSPYGYSDIDSFFQNLGYTKNTSFFIFTYDWRKDIRSTQTDLDNLIETAKQKTNSTKVDIVAHSLGGLVARYYISDSAKASKVNKLIELGTPHLGSPLALKNIMYGNWLKANVLIFTLGIIPDSEVRDISQNMTSGFQLLPSNTYYSFYDNSSTSLPPPIKDDRDIDSNKETGSLTFTQLKTLLSNLAYNMTAFGFHEQLHDFLDSKLSNSSGVKLYNIVGSSQPTLGQINETWWVKWPIQILPKKEEIYINGDDTVPLYSASLKNDSRDLSAGAKLYFVEQKHEDLPITTGPAMQTVRAILNEVDTVPTEVKDQKITLEGQQLSADQNVSLDLYDDSNNHTGLDSNGNVETNIPNTFYDSLEDSRHVFIKKSALKVTARLTSSQTVNTNIKIRTYSNDSITKTVFYKDIPVSAGATTQVVINTQLTTAPNIIAGSQTIPPTAELTGSSAMDQSPPATKVDIAGTKDSSGSYTNSVTITLNGSDSDAGILRTEYSLDNGKTVQTYTAPFTISTAGTNTLQVKSIDKLGNEEIPQTITITITQPASQTSSSSSSSSDTSVSSTSQTTSAPPTIPNTEVKVLGVSFKNPFSNSSSNTDLRNDQYNKPVILGASVAQQPQGFNPALKNIVVVSMVIGGVLSFGLIASFFLPPPH